MQCNAMCSKVSYILSREPQVEGKRFFLVFVFVIQKERIESFMQHWRELCDLGQVGGLGQSRAPTAYLAIYRD